MRIHRTPIARHMLLPMGANPIVVAMDGSTAAEKALLVALDIAVGQQARVILLHATDAVRGFFVAHPADEPTPNELARLDPVLGAAARVAAERGVEAEIAVVDARGAESIAGAIAGFASGVDASMIVVGTRGHGDLVSSVLGSVSHGLLRSADVPVVVVNASAET